MNLYRCFKRSTISSCDGVVGLFICKRRNCWLKFCYFTTAVPLSCCCRWCNIKRKKRKHYSQLNQVRLNFKRNFFLLLLKEWQHCYPKLASRYFWWSLIVVTRTLWFWHNSSESGVFSSLYWHTNYSTSDRRNDIKSEFQWLYHVVICMIVSCRDIMK